MKKISPVATCGALLVATALSACSTSASITTPSTAEKPAATTLDSRHALDAGYQETLDRLYATTPGSQELVAKARGVLVFPHVVSAGLVIGGAYGDGELRVRKVVDSYYHTTTGSVGWQIGAESRALVYLFMTPEALKLFRDNNGLSGGLDASVALLKVGANGTLDANAAREPMVAFVMTNAGLMAGVTLEGTKVSRID